MERDTERKSPCRLYKKIRRKQLYSIRDERISRGTSREVKCNMPSVTINRAECTSCTTCWSTCPEVFEEDPKDGMSRIVEHYRKSGDLANGEIPDEHAACAQEAADICPVSIITLSA
jgi:ferredoxin